MRVAILETIVMPAGHEMEFDRILVDELKRQGHTPVFFVPEKFPFKLDYKCEVEYLDGGEVVTYAGANRFQKLFLSLKREQRRRAWFNSAYKKICEYKCDMLIIPTATYRYLKAIRATKLKNSPVPLRIIFHGINPHEKANFVKQARACEQYQNIRLKVITLRNDFFQDNLKNVDLIVPPVFKPMDLVVDKDLHLHEPLTLGFYGQYRREKNVRFFLDAFKQAKFNVPVKLICQGATAMQEDSDEFEKIISEYRDIQNIEFWHKNLIGEEWQRALLDCDVIVAPYAAERYRYYWSAMLFTAIGFYKPILQSPEMNPEVLQEFRVGEMMKLDSVENLSKQLEKFVDTFADRVSDYRKGLIDANECYSHEGLIDNLMDDCENVENIICGVSEHINVVLASDNNYAQHLAVTAVSILENTRRPESICFYVLSDGISEENWLLIERTIQHYGSSVIKIDCDEFSVAGFYTQGHITKATYLRLNVANVLPKDVNKAIYLDVDLLVLNDLFNLWNIDMQSKPLAAVPDLAIMCSKRMMRLKHQVLGFDENENYFNAGMLVIDVEQWRREHYSEKVIEVAQNNKFRHQDQDALNLVFKRDWLPLDFKWNVIPPIWAMQLKIYFSKFRSHAVTAHNNPAIIHYAGRYKPWEFVIKQGFNEKYYEYLEKTEFRNKKMSQPGNMKGKSLLRQMMRIKIGNWLCR